MRDGNDLIPLLADPHDVLRKCVAAGGKIGVPMDLKMRDGTTRRFVTGEVPEWFIEKTMRALCGPNYRKRT